jgi:hypothetical protein
MSFLFSVQKTSIGMVGAISSSCFIIFLCAQAPSFYVTELCLMPEVATSEEESVGIDVIWSNRSGIFIKIVPICLIGFPV